MSLADGREHSLSESFEYISNKFKLNTEERAELLPSGQQLVVHNRIGWAKTYMKKANLIETTKRGYFKITERGEIVLKERPAQIDIQYLLRFPEFVEFRSIKRGKVDIETSVINTPHESLESSYEIIRNELVQGLLNSIKESTPGFFEKLVIDLLLKMGYGGSRKDAGEAIGKVGDEGIDGIIKEDKLGLDVIYVQAKRWEGIVGRPEIHKFVGALEGKRAKKGIFITSSAFTKEANEYVAQIGTKVILIDGNALANYMIDNDVGVAEVANYKIKRIDTDYFLGESAT
jgi:restriction system protein